MFQAEEEAGRQWVRTAVGEARHMMLAVAEMPAEGCPALHSLFCDFSFSLSSAKNFILDKSVNSPI